MRTEVRRPLYHTASTAAVSLLVQLSLSVCLALLLFKAFHVGRISSVVAGVLIVDFMGSYLTTKPFIDTLLLVVFHMYVAFFVLWWITIKEGDVRDLQTPGVLVALQVCTVVVVCVCWFFLKPRESRKHLTLLKRVFSKGGSKYLPLIDEGNE